MKKQCNTDKKLKIIFKKKEDLLSTILKKIAVTKKIKNNKGFFQ
jgi:hypothetical protein